MVEKLAPAKVRWAEPALADRERIVRYIAEDNLSAALNLLDRFDAVGDQLEEFSLSGCQGVSIWHSRDSCTCTLKNH